jgi:hypothetical protein
MEPSSAVGIYRKVIFTKEHLMLSADSIRTRPDAFITKREIEDYFKIFERNPKKQYPFDTSGIKLQTCIADLPVIVRASDPK